MTRAATKPESVENGAEAPVAKTLEERIAALEQQVARMAVMVATLMAEKMQPQVQQSILGRITGA